MSDYVTKEELAVIITRLFHAIGKEIDFRSTSYEAGGIAEDVLDDVRRSIDSALTAWKEGSITSDEKWLELLDMYSPQNCWLRRAESRSRGEGME